MPEGRANLGVDHLHSFGQQGLPKAPVVVLRVYSIWCYDIHRIYEWSLVTRKLDPQSFDQFLVSNEIGKREKMGHLTPKVTFFGEIFQVMPLTAGGSPGLFQAS